MISTITMFQADSGKGAAIVALWRLALAAVVVVRWSKNLNIIFIIFVVLCTSCELMEQIRIFPTKKEG
jgi:hypothetical protein